MKNKGRYIAIEGLEGAGKTSAMQTVTTVLDDNNIAYRTCREPGGTPYAENIRALLKSDMPEKLFHETELLLMYAARKQLLANVILPALSQGIWIISDRCDWSSIAYQAYGRGLDIAFVQSLSSFIVKKSQPDLLLYLEIDPHTGLERAAQRGAYDRIEQSGADFFTRVHSGYQALVKENNNVLTINAQLPLDEVQFNIATAIKTFVQQIKDVADE